MARNQEAFMKAGNKYILEYLRAAQDLLQEEESDDWVLVFKFRKIVFNSFEKCRFLKIVFISS